MNESFFIGMGLRVRQNLYLFAIIAIWGLLGWYYLVHVPVGVRSHDLSGHLQYVQIIAQQHRLPLPHEGWETYHPPLYYLIVSLLDPLGGDHILLARLFSLLCGAVFLVLLDRFLTAARISTGMRMLLLLYVLSTPAFAVTVFTAYGNDPLVTVLCALMIVATWRLWNSWSSLGALLLLVAVTAALYTKLTSIFAIAACLGMLLLGWWRAKDKSRLVGRIAAIYFGSALLFLPWLYFHNYRLSGEWLPNNFSGLSKNVFLAKSPFAFNLTPPGLSSQEWATPYDLTPAYEVGGKQNFTAVSLSSGLFSESSYPAALDTLAWGILWTRVLLTIGALVVLTRRASQALAAVCIIGMAGIVQMAFVAYSFYISSADFRYIAWVWLPLAVLWGNLAETSPGKGKKSGMGWVWPALLLAGSVVQLIFVTEAANLG